MSSSKGVRLICIDNKNKPSDYPLSGWINEGTQYTLKHVHKMVRQGFCMGFELMEINSDKITNGKYSCFLGTRFGVPTEDIPELIEMMKLCGELNDLNIQEQVDHLELITVDNE